MRLKVIEIDRSDAAQYVARWHRHLPPSLRCQVAFAALDPDGWVRGVITIGRPVSRVLQERGYCEATRCATDGARNACSCLYGAARRWAAAQGKPICTYTRTDEPGTSLRAAGWRAVATTRARQWSAPSRPRRANEQIAKTRWEAVMPARARRAA